MSIKASVIAIICLISLTNVFAQAAQSIKFPLPDLTLRTSLPTPETQDKTEGEFLFNPKKLRENAFLLSINGGLPIPNLGFRTSFPLGKFDGHFFYYYYLLGGIQFARPEIDFFFTERYKLTADLVLSDAPFLNTDTSAKQDFNLVAAGIVTQISSFSYDNCFSGHIGYYKANTAIPNTKVNNLIYIGLVYEDKSLVEKRGIYHKLGVYMPVSSEQKLVYPSYSYGYVFY